MLDEVRSAYSYSAITDAEWEWVLDFVVRGGASLKAYPDFHRVEIVDGRYVVLNRRIIANHRMNIGTIASDAAMQVKYLKGATLGTAEESFLSKLKPGERFLFAGRLVELVRIRDNAAYVRRAKGQADSVPRWAGGRMPLSSELSDALRQKVEEAASGKLQGREMQSLKGLFAIQTAWSILPRCNQLLIERIKTRYGYQVFLFPFEGRLVHEGMAALFAYRLSEREKSTLSLACNDYGLVLQSPTKIAIAEAIDAGLFSTRNLEEDILRSLNATEMSKRQFRQIARVAGLVQQGFPGTKKSSSYIQASSNLFFDAFTQYDPNNLLLDQSRREVLEFQLEASRMATALERIGRGEIVIKDPPKITPLSFPLMVDKLRERVSSESLVDRIKRMQSELEQAADQYRTPS